ncbi:MAG: LacI family transcriptional regulator [Clostridia bacterium]|nr:LacI family transcriptional regulator [Clostridia bacterium]
MAVTIRDVAKAAGVSISTVSKVIHDAPTISDETKARVKKIMEELSYYPNLIARSFAQQNSYTIGLIMSLKREDAFLNPYIYEILGGIEEVAQKYGYSLSVINLSTVLKDPTELERLIIQKRIDGLLIHLTGFTKNLFKIIAKSQFPFVFIGHPPFKAESTWVDIDNTKAGEIAATHLINRGARRIAFVGQGITSNLTHKRYEGYKKALEEAHIPLNLNFVKDAGSDLSNISALVQDLLDHERPDAMVLSSNFVAMEVLKILQKNKVNVPKDMKLITFDNYPFAPYTSPSLSVVDMDVFELGVQSCNLLLKKLKNPEFLSHTVLSPTVIQRESSAI